MKNLFTLFIFGLNIICVLANPVAPGKFNILQSNGDTIEVYLKGDEYGSWYEAKNGDIIDIEPNTLNFYYVKPVADTLALSNMIVSNNSISLFDKALMMEIIENNRSFVYDKLHPSHVDFDSTDQETMAYIQNLSFNDSIHQQRVKKRIEPINSKKILTILMEFQDVKFEHPLSVRNLVDSMINEEYYHLPNINETFPSVNSYYKSASYNKLDIKADVVGPYTANHNRKFYGAKTLFSNDVIAKRLVYEAICKASSEVDFSDYDNDGDGYVECIHVLFAGQGQSEKGAPKETIWPHQGSMKIILRDDVCISGYILTPEKYQEKYVGIGTICHELGHIFGAPDFYDTKHNKDTFPGTGTWDLMGNGCWNGAYKYAKDCYIRAYAPAHPNPYIKNEIFGWIETIDELSGNDSLYKLRPAELDSNGIYKLSTSTKGEYYLLENRQDPYLWGTGLLVYHVHKNIKNGFLLNNVNVKHPQKMYVVDANNHVVKPDGLGNYGIIDSTTATFRSTHSQNMYFTSESLPSNCDWDENPTQNKDVCFISEEEIDGETCILFVLNPEIEGDDILCDSAIYSLKHVPAEATIEWTYVTIPGMTLPNVPVHIGSGQGTTEVYYKRGIILKGGTFQDTIDNPDIPFLPVPLSRTTPTFVPYSGDVTLKVNITFNGNTHSLFKTINIPSEIIKVEIEELNLGLLNAWCKGVTKTISLTSTSEEDWMDEVIWYIDLPGRVPYYNFGSSISVTPTDVGMATIIATHSDGCGEFKSDTVRYQIIQLLGTSFANPVSGSVEISIIGGDELNGNSNVPTMALDNQTGQYIGACRLELWHDIYGKVREMDVPENTSVVTMDLNGLSSGIYILRLIVDNQIVETSQMIIK